MTRSEMPEGKQRRFKWPNGDKKYNDWWVEGGGLPIIISSKNRRRLLFSRVPVFLLGVPS
jgi:hypothetical protein